MSIYKSDQKQTTHWWWVIVLVVLAGIIGGTIWYLQINSSDFDLSGNIIYNQAAMTSDSDGLADFREGSVDPAVIVSTPQPNVLITNPLTVVGEAPGTWFFEATLQLELQDLNGNILATSFGTTQDDWMTEDMVPFTGTIEMDATTISAVQATGETDGLLLIKADNPSGLSENIQVFALPVQLISTELISN